MTERRRDLSRLVDTVVSVSDRTLAVHREAGVFEKGGTARVIRNPPPSADAGAPVAELENRPIVFGFLGRVSIEKGSLLLAKAFRDVPRDRGRLVFAGHADEAIRNQIAEAAGSADVEFLGFVKPEQFFGKIDVMVLPSLWEEPSPMTVGEAFAYARPVVGTRRGGIPELLSDERTGWLFEPGHESLSALLKQICENAIVVVEKSQYLNSQSNRRTFDDLVSEYVEVYERAIAGKRR